MSVPPISLVKHRETKHGSGSDKKSREFRFPISSEGELCRDHLTRGNVQDCACCECVEGPSRPGAPGGDEQAEQSAHRTRDTKHRQRNCRIETLDVLLDEPHSQSNPSHPVMRQDDHGGHPHVLRIGPCTDDRAFEDVVKRECDHHHVSSHWIPFKLDVMGCFLHCGGGLCVPNRCHPPTAPRLCHKGGGSPLRTRNDSRQFE
mmetsp:Transcript_3336/g.6901  ORF Transcript_3336/g.6901 Transcript_3336/m.6901 type:complete len:203 (-) Transcript_3336:174-782(-)